MFGQYVAYMEANGSTCNRRMSAPKHLSEILQRLASGEGKTVSVASLKCGQSVSVSDPGDKITLDGPALVTVGDATASGEVAFYLLGSQHTEIPRRNLIPTSSARRLAKQFLETGRLPKDATWEAA